MAREPKVLSMKCDVCGTKIVVSTSAECRLEPIYCCGLEVVSMETSTKDVSTGNTEAGKK